MGTARVMKLFGRGRVDWYEDPANGANKIAIRAPATLAADYEMILPTALPGAPQFISVAPDGTWSFSAGSGSLQSAYDAGATIVETVGKPIAVSSAHDNDVLTLTKTGLGAGEVLQVADAGTGTAILLTKTGDGFGLRAVYDLATTQAMVQIEAGASCTQPPLRIAITAGAAVGTRGIVIIQGAAAIGLYVEQNGANVAHYVSQTAASKAGYFEKTSFSADTCFHIVNNGVGIGLYVQQLSQDGVAARIDQGRNTTGLAVNKTATGAGSVIAIDNDGTGVGLNVMQDGDGNGIALTKGATGADAALVITDAGSGPGMLIEKSGNGKGARIFKTGLGGGVALEVENDGIGLGLLVQQDGVAVAVSITQAADEISLSISKAGAGAGNLIDLTNGGTGKDIDGDSSAWFVEKGGHGRFATLRTPTSGVLTLAGGVVTKTGGYHTLAGEGAADDELDTINGGASGDFLVLRASSDAVTVTLKDGTGNLALEGDFALNSDQDTIMLFFVGTVWYELCRSNNGA